MTTLLDPLPGSHALRGNQASAALLTLAPEFIRVGEHMQPEQNTTGD